MKKLLFAIAGAASFAALAADPSAGANDISLVGFESYTVDATVIGATDDGNSGTSLWSATGDDASTVKTYGGDNAAAPSITEPRPFAGETNEKYLALDTNGSELKRDVQSGGSALAVAAAGTYVDTLVQFTPSESAPGETDLDGAKLAIWLGVVEGVTNLYVQGNAWDIDEGFQGTPQAFALSGKTIEPGTWYRLTVKAIPNILGEDTGSSISAFQISVDGTDMTLAASPFSADMLTTLAEYGAGAYASAAIQTAFAANKLVPAIQEEIGTYGDTVTLTTVGFKGTGALDDFVVTTEPPSFAPSAISLTLTWTAAEVDAVAYVLESDPATTNVLSNGTAASIPAAAIGTNATLVVTFASGYEFDYLAIGDYHHPYLTFPVPAVSTNATLVAKATPAGWVDDPTTVASETAAVAYPALAGTALATANAGELTTWAKANSVSFTDATTDPDDYVEAFLLNCAVAEVEDEKDEFKANITVGADGTITVTTPDGKDYNGTLKLKGKANLSDAVWTDVPNNTPTSSYHFYMYELSL